MKASFSCVQFLIIFGVFRDLFPFCGECYLDHAGAALYSERQLEHVFADLSSNIYANPHARNTASQSTQDAVDIVRYQILSYFNTTQEEYSVIFTSGATHALKLIAETFEFNGGTLAYLEDNHTSVLGMRNFAPNFREVKVGEAFNILSQEFDIKNSQQYVENCLFVFPAQSNFAGTKYPLSWIEAVKHGVLEKLTCKAQKWYTLLDAATFVSTSHLDLNKFKPDFVAISFYKIFGYPTGIGVLLVRKSSEKLLRKHYFGGGTVLMALSSENVMIPRPNICERFEDGTIPFLSILAIRHGFDTLKRLQITLDTISQHTYNLAKYTFDNLLEMHHSNSEPVAVMYHDTYFESCDIQGGIVNFNLKRSEGEYVGYAEVLHIANLHNIYLRTGCFCNPGACQKFLKLSSDDVRKHFEAGHVCGDQHDLVDGYPTGTVRISFGYMSTYEDADKFLQMIEKCFVTHPIVRKKRKFNQTIYCINNEIEQVKNCNKNNGFSVSKVTNSNLKGNDKTKNGFISSSIKLTEKINADSTSYPKQKDESPIVKQGSDVQDLVPYINADPTAKRKPNDDIITANQDSNVPNFVPENEMVVSSSSSSSSCHTGSSCSSFSSSSRSSSPDKQKVIGKLTKIFLYPVKSCGAYSVEDAWTLTKIGLKYDRRWMIVNASGSCVSQKQIKRLCTLRPILDFTENKLKLTIKGAEEISTPLHPPEHEARDAFFCDSKVCGDKIRGFDCGDGIAEWLSINLDRPGLRLLRQCDFSTNISGRNSQQGKQTMLSLANKAEYLLINTASVRWLKERIPQEDALYLTEDSVMSRFRANFVVDFEKPFIENKLDIFHFDVVMFKSAGNCTRCQMICVDQETGSTSKEPLQTLSREMKGRICFGVYLNQQSATEENAIKLGCNVIANFQKDNLIVEK